MSKNHLRFLLALNLTQLSTVKEYIFLFDRVRCIRPIHRIRAI